ncbi:MAG: DUF3459 domain-containing protein, partial [bacterium]|nr:DUF3459 domain-containing protein [bacterium]
GLGLMVLLDVVYNHFGPEGNYLNRYAPAFFTERYRTPWGAAIDFEGAASRTVRDFVIQNALYWLQEYHLDGLRLDAVHAVHDRTRPDVLEELAAAVRKAIPAARHVHLVLENDANQARYLAPRRGARAHYDAQWNDDAHHAYHVLLTGEHTGYYADFAQAPAAQLGRTLTQGFAFQGEVSACRQAPRGEASDDLPLTRFVTFLQNHDQIGNRALGERITTLAGADAVRAASAVLLLAPSPPLLFMGEEWGASTPFLFFCDFEPELARRVSEGRRKAFSGLPEFSDPRGRAQIPDPNQEQTFLRSTLRWDERARPAHRAWLDHYARLLELRHSTIVPRIARLAGGCGRYETFQQTGLLAHWRLDDGSRLTLIGNLGVRPLAGASALAQHLRGETLYASHPELRREAAAGALGAWSVLWLLET